MKVGTMLSAALLAALQAMAAPLPAQTLVPGDPHADDPAGIVSDPCPVGRTVENAGGWAMSNLHMVTRDFGQLCRYRADNARLIAAKAKVRVVFMGDSITDNWIGADRDLFTNGLVDRGISGQTTPQMLVRFRQDVIALHPQAVHIMAGTNDIAGNTGAAAIDMVQGNIESMAELARAHGIKVILASVPPAIAFGWKPAMRPAPQIRAFNAWLRDYARRNRFTYVDYHGAMTTPDGGMKPGLASDEVHPTPAGYAVMRPLALDAVRRALGR